MSLLARRCNPFSVMGAQMDEQREPSGRIAIITIFGMAHSYVFCARYTLASRPYCISARRTYAAQSV